MKEKSNIFNRDNPLTVMITGGSSGIGFQAVLKLISLGHNIILPCKNISRANEVLTNLFNHFLDESSKKGEIYTPIMDLSDLSSIDSLCSEVKNRRWTIDVLILNAGLQYTGSKIAGKILDNWDVEINNFVKVMPKALKEVLTARDKKHLKAI